MKSKNLIDLPHEFLCPKADGKLRLAVLMDRHPGMTLYRKKGSDAAPQETVDRTTLAKAKNRLDQRGLTRSQLERIAKNCSENPDWLCSGFSPIGEAIWPTWTDEWTRPAQQVILDIFHYFLSRLALGRSAPSVVVRVVFGDLNLDRVMPYPAIESDAQFSETTAGFRRLIQDYLRKQQLDIDQYLSRYRWLLEDEWKCLAQPLAQLSRDPNKVLANIPLLTAAARSSQLIPARPPKRQAGKPRRP